MHTVGNGPKIKTVARASTETIDSESNSTTVVGLEAVATVASPNNMDDSNVITPSYTSAQTGNMEAVDCSITKSCFESSLDEEEEMGGVSDASLTSLSSDSIASHISSFISHTSTPIQTRRSKHNTRSSDKEGERDRSRSVSRSRSPPVNKELKSSRKQLNKK